MADLKINSASKIKEPLIRRNQGQSHLQGTHPSITLVNNGLVEWGKKSDCWSKSPANSSKKVQHGYGKIHYIGKNK